ncbi:hypothetical protein JW964_16695 [candidate division KSB1 bacterium]|nr:hypothetical protein [candidate division KSB1 bacterium]
MNKIIISLLALFIVINGRNIISGQNVKQNNSQKAMVTITPADIAMAKEVIQSNTKTVPGYTPGSQAKISAGNFGAADALVLYLLKFHQQTRICPPIAVVTEALKKLKDSEIHKKAVSYFWLDYSTSSGLDQHIAKPNAFRNDFDWYILTKFTERLKYSNIRDAAYVGADQAWRRAMNSQQQFWEKSQARNDEYLLKRDANRAVFDAQAAVAAAEKAVAGS